MNTKEIRGRWSEYCQKKFMRDLLMNESAEDRKSPFGLTSEGFVDYRGVSVRESIHALKLERIDFSFSELGGQLFSKFHDCRFIGLRGRGGVGVEFVNCEFSGSHIKEASFSGNFSLCSFDDVKLLRPSINSVSFYECKFVNFSASSPKIYESNFQGCQFVSSKIKNGALTGCKFIGCGFDEFVLDGVFLSQNHGLDGESGVKIINQFDPAKWKSGYSKKGPA